MNSWKKAQKSQNRGKKNSVFLRFLRFFAAMLGCLFSAPSGHGLPSRQLPGWRDQPLSQVEQARETRFDKAGP